MARKLASMALGLALILSLNSVINMAHGGFLVIGAYLAYTLDPYLGFWGALIAGPVLAGAVGLIVERVTGNPLEQELRQRVIEPLGLRATALSPPTADPGDRNSNSVFL